MRSFVVVGCVVLLAAAGGCAPESPGQSTTTSTVASSGPTEAWVPADVPIDSDDYPAGAVISFPNRLGAALTNVECMAVHTADDRRNINTLTEIAASRTCGRLVDLTESTAVPLLDGVHWYRATITFGGFGPSEADNLRISW